MKVQLSKRIIVQEEIDETTIKNAMLEFKSEQARYRTLFRYYVGNHDFSSAHSDGNRIVCNFCKYIPQTLQGYMFGNKPTYDHAEGDLAAEEIIDTFNEQEMWLMDSRIGLDMSIYGKAFELVYLPEGKDKPRSMLIHPTDAFVAYAGDLERDSIFGAVYFHYEVQNLQERHTLYVYDRQNFTRWESVSQDGPWALVEGPTPHGFGRVPLIEYRNNEEMIGDFEGILDLQDAYNSLISDRQDDKDAFAAGVMVLKGQVMGDTKEEIGENMATLRKLKLLHLDDDADVSWLAQTFDESSVQIVQDQYAKDIHKFAMVPDLSDEQFAGNASGIAMAYKLFGTDQVVAEKVEQFRMGFRRRCKLYDYKLHNPTLNPSYEPVADLKSLTVNLSMNTPQDLSYISTALTTLVSTSIISKDTARRNVYIVDDPEEEAKKIEEEQSRESEMNSAAYEDPFGGFGQGVNDVGHGMDAEEAQDSDE